MLRTMILVMAVMVALPAAADVHSGRLKEPTGRERLEGLTRVAATRGCKAMGSCEDAVKLWCGGYSRADADHDGIPCENVCSSLEDVNKIKAAIGC